MSWERRHKNKSKNYGSKLKDKYLLRRRNRGSKYQMGVEYSFETFLEREINFEYNYPILYSFSKYLNSSPELRYTLMLTKLYDGGIRLRHHRQNAHNKERSWKKQFFQALNKGDEVRSEKLYMKRYGSIGWDIY